MRPYEQTYLLDELQLLQLLSCLDTRPVLGMPINREDAENNINQVTLSLVNDGWLIPDERGFMIPHDRAMLLLAIKDAPRVLSVVFRGEDCPVRTLYTGGDMTVAVEAYAPGCRRVYEVSKGIGEWLEEADALPGHPLEENSCGLLLSGSPSLSGTLKKLEHSAPEFSAPPLEWGKREGVWTVLDLYDGCTARHLCRWVWTTEPAECSVLIKQCAESCFAAIDTVERRKSVFEACSSGVLLPCEGMSAGMT